MNKLTPRIKAKTTMSQIMEWLTSETLTLMEFYEQLEWRQLILKNERAIIKKSML